MAKKYPVRLPAPIGDLIEESCKHCKGTGQEPKLRDLTCRVCIGRGRQKWRIDECKECEGKGKKSFFSLTKCKNCKGQGWRRRDVG